MLIHFKQHSPYLLLDEIPGKNLQTRCHKKHSSKYVQKIFQRAKIIKTKTPTTTTQED